MLAKPHDLESVWYQRRNPSPCSHRGMSCGLGAPALSGMFRDANPSVHDHKENRRFRFEPQQAGKPSVARRVSADRQYPTYGVRMDEQPDSPSNPGRAANSGNSFLGGDVDSFHSGLRLLGAWAIRERGAVHVGDLLDSMKTSGSRPAEIDHLWQIIRRFELRSLVDLAEDVADLNRSVDDLQTVVGSRQIEIFRQRVLEGRTLAQVGRSLGLTRERVRQLQKKIKPLLFRAMQRDEFRWLRIRAHDLRSKLGFGAPEGHAATFDAVETALTGVRSDIRWLARILLLECAGPYLSQKGWLTLDWSGLVDRTALLRCADAYGLVPAQAARQTLIQRGLRPEFHNDWLFVHGRMRLFGTHLADWSGNVVDKCAAMLSLLQRPATVEELVELVGEGHNTKGVRNRMVEDPRFIRVNKTELALSSWGVDEYSGITEEIRKYILAAGGEAAVNDIVTSIVNRFGVKRTSVELYVHAPMFECQGGRVRIRGGPVAEGPHPLGREVPLPWLLESRRGQVHLVVDAEVLRGSGRPCSVELCRLLGIEPGHHRQFSFVEGSVHVGWPATSPHPNLGSVRKLIRYLGASLGDRVLLEFDSTTGEVEARIQQTD